MRRFDLFLLVISIFSCQNKEGNYRSKLEAEIKTVLTSAMGDPSSYDPIQTVIIDTVLYSENLTYAIEKGDEDGQYKRKLDSLNKSVNPKSIAAYLVIHSFRSKNGFNAIVLNNFYIETLPDFKVINYYSESDMEKRFMYPGGFP